MSTKKMLRKWTEEEIYAEATGQQPITGQMEEEQPQQRNEDDYSQIKSYFPDWNDIPVIEKDKYKNMWDRYHHMIESGVPVSAPFFMNKSTATEPAAKRLRTQKSPVAAERSSSRLKQSSSSTVNYYESPTKSTNKRQPSLLMSPTSSPERSMNEELISLSPPQPQDNSASGSSSANNTMARRPRGQGPPPPARGPGGVPKTLFSTFDKQVHGLPNFGEKSKCELRKLRMNMNMHAIHLDCKSHVRRQKDGKEYLSRKEWDNYTKRICDAYPNLKSEGKKYWTSFKVGLQKSFSAERKREKKKAAKKAMTEDQEEESEGEDDPNTSDKHPLDVEAEAAAKELRTAQDRRVMKGLIEKSLSYRKIERETLTPRELLEMYPYLKTPEMMIFDYLTNIEIALEECERVFTQNVQLIGAHFDIDFTTEYGKLNTMLRVHEFFVSKAVKKGLKPVLIVREEERQNLQDMESSNIQAPFIVVFRRQNFVTAEYELRSATLLMANELVSSLNSPTVDKIMLMLLGAYVTLNTEYPSPYQQFMRALEKLVTGKQQPSKYGRSQVQYDRLMSLVNKK